MKLATLCYVIDSKTNSVLMLHRVKKKNDMHEGKWNGLGGKLDTGESPEECVVREIYEESGLTIENPTLIGFITFPAFDGFEDWYVFLFKTNTYSGQLIDSAEGNLQWIPMEELLSLNLWEGDRIFIPWVMGNKFFSAKFIYDKGRLLHHIVHFH